ncbi:MULTISPECIES: hypothetical protein [Pseudomonas]|uniref:hypothetical protein n=1 Tax=Pseudomonas TaxID=286 RepID=UPI00137B69FB|nr:MULTISPECIES: hypothetical protein [Pseudomonas]HDS0986120.1 hypothetical protein [Pseudomonas putida]
MSEQENAPSANKPLSTTRIHVKLRKALKSELEKKAADNFMSLSQLLLQSARNSTITVRRIDAPKNSKELLALTAAYNKFGAQLNMIAKHCNTFKANSDSVKILTALIDIERSVAELKAETLGED